MTNKQAVTSLLQQIKELEAAGAAGHGHPDNERRGRLLDELQDEVGLGGRMVMESDIVKRAEKLLASS